VATQTQFGPIKKTAVRAIRPDLRRPRLRGDVTKSSTCAVTALSIEFVAKPEAVRDVRSAIPAAINGCLQDVTGFAGCLTMVSDQESRLVTVVTFWTGQDRATRCSKTARWVQKLVSPYLDHCLRQRTFDAYLPAISALSDDFSETNSDLPCDLQPRQEEDSLCVA
jgi:hypothetical protein